MAIMLLSAPLSAQIFLLSIFAITVSKTISDLLSSFLLSGFTCFSCTFCDFLIYSGFFLFYMLLFYYTGFYGVFVCFWSTNLILFQFVPNAPVIVCRVKEKHSLTFTFWIKVEIGPLATFWDPFSVFGILALVCTDASVVSTMWFRWE